VSRIFGQLRLAKREGLLDGRTVERKKICNQFTTRFPALSGPIFGEGRSVITRLLLRGRLGREEAFIIMLGSTKKLSLSGGLTFYSQPTAYFL